MCYNTMLTPQIMNDENKNEIEHKKQDDGHCIIIRNRDFDEIHKHWLIL